MWAAVIGSPNALFVTGAITDPLFLGGAPISTEDLEKKTAIKWDSYGLTGKG